MLKNITPQSIQSIGWIYDYAAFTKNVNGFFDMSRLRIIRMNLQEHWQL
jgi:hypothetical protein